MPRAGRGSHGRANLACNSGSVGIFDISPADRAVLISSGGGNWLNVANLALMIDQAVAGTSTATAGWVATGATPVAPRALRRPTRRRSTCRTSRSRRVSVTGVRTFATNSATDPVGIGAL